MNLNEENLYGSYLNDLVSNKKPANIISFDNLPRLLRFKTMIALPSNQNNVASTRIEGPYLKTYESNNVVPTPLSSFVESIYPLSELNDEIIQDINPYQFRTHQDMQQQRQPPQLSIRTCNSYNFENPYSLNLTVPKVPELKTNFEEEANNLTRRIMTGNLKNDHSDENYSNKLLIKQKITCVEDLIGKKRSKTIKRKPPKRPYRKKALSNTDKAVFTNKIQHGKNNLQFLEETNIQMINQPSTIANTNIDDNSNLKLSIDLTNDINIDALFEDEFIESTKFQNSSPTTLDASLDTLLVSNTSLPMNQEVDLHISSLPTTSPEFFPLNIPLDTTPIDKTFDITTNDAFTSKSCDILLTPSSADDHVSLVKQLKNDRPLFEAISKKQKRGSYKCAHCPQTFPNLMEYAAHMDEFNIKREFKCPFALCPWKILGLPRRSDLRRHCAIQHKDELQSDLKSYLNLKDEAYPTILCPNEYCGKEFYRKDAFNRHVAIVHDNNNSRFNRKLAILLQQCPNDLTKKEQIKYVKENMNKKIGKSKK